MVYGLWETVADPIHSNRIEGEIQEMQEKGEKKRAEV